MIMRIFCNANLNTNMTLTKKNVFGVHIGFQGNSMRSR